MGSNPFVDFDPEHLALLTPEEQAEFYRGLETLVGGESLYDFIARVYPHEPPPRHIRPIIDVIQTARMRPMRVCLDIGAGHSKTTTLMRGIAWWLCRSPADLCAYVSYSDDQARDKSRLAKEGMGLAGKYLSSEKGGVGHWLTPQGGGLVAVGSRGGLMGKRIPGLLVYDDPYKDAQEARSPAINGMVIERFKAAAFTRLQGGSIIVVHSRLDTGDLIGWILKNLKWDHISIPSICDDPANDLLGRKAGEAAWPERYPVEICSQPCGHDGHLAEIKRTLGDHLFAGIYQGKPRAEGTRIFHEPARYRRNAGVDSDGRKVNSEFTWEGKRGVLAIDPAATARKTGDWSVIAECAMANYGASTIMWVTDLIRIQCEIPELVARARRKQMQTRLMVSCEAVGGFKGVPQSLRQIDVRDHVSGLPEGKLRVKDYNPGSRDKFTRALPLSAAWNDGRVLIPMDVSWADDLIDRFQRFSGAAGGEDDEIDAIAQAWEVLYRAHKVERQGDYEGGIV